MLRVGDEVFSVDLGPLKMKENALRVGDEVFFVDFGPFKDKFLACVSLSDRESTYYWVSVKVPLKINLNIYFLITHI